MKHHGHSRTNRGWIKIFGLAALALILGLFTGPVAAGERDALLVGISPHSPFVYWEDDRPKGFSIDLWQAVADRMNLDFSFMRSTQLKGVLEDLRENRVDVAVGGIAVTEEREHHIDFTHSFFTSGLGILVKTQKNLSASILFRSLFQKKRLRMMSIFVLFIVAAGHLIWLMERRQPINKKSFSRKYLPGILEGMYWVIVTASTVGYGDRVPRSWAGRALAACLIIVSLPLFGLFIARLSSDITIYELQSSISRPRDLIERRVGVVGGTFSPQDYAMATPEGSLLRERLNRTILSMIEEGEVEAIRKKWFGTSF